MGRRIETIYVPITIGYTNKLEQNTNFGSNFIYCILMIFLMLKCHFNCFIIETIVLHRVSRQQFVKFMSMESINVFFGIESKISKYEIQMNVYGDKTPETIYCL